MKIIATSDWHLDAVTSGVERWDEIEAAIDHSIDVAKSERVDLYLMGGDVCNPDAPCAVRAIAKTIEVAKRLDLAGIPSIWLAGNHDVIEDGFGTTILTPLAESGVAYAVFEEPDSVVFNQTAVVGLPFTPKSHAYDPTRAVVDLAKRARNASGDTGSIIVLGHLHVEGIAAGSETKDFARGREVFWPLKIIARELPGAVCIAGHYHEAQEHDDLMIVGSLARLTHGEETIEPSLLIVEV